ncbi:phage head morphogenesis protein [Desulfosoma sp.]
MPLRLAADPGDTPLQTPATPGEFARAFRLPPAEAVDYMQGRDRVRITYDWTELWQDEHARQFTVSRLVRADLLDALRRGIERSVDGDLTRRDWIKDARAVLVQEGWWGEKQVVGPDGRVRTTHFNPRRLELIYDVNTRMAYAAGRWERLQAAKATHPYLRYVTRNDERVRASHRAWHNVTLPVDDPWWQTHYPPNGWRCRCTVAPLRERDVEAAPALKRQAPDEPTVAWKNPHTGEVLEIPANIDPGFGYNVGQASQRWKSLLDAVAGRIVRLPALEGAALFESLDDVALGKVADVFAGFFAEALAEPPSGRMALAGAISRRILARLANAGITPASAEIMVRDKDLWHALRDTKTHAIAQAWWARLPVHLRAPQAVLLDKTHAEPALIYVFAAQHEKKILLKLDYRIKKPQRASVNIVRTGAVLSDGEIESLRGQMGKGMVLLDGHL